MNQLQKVFNYRDVELRTIIKDEDVWFVAKDICKILEIKNVSDAVGKIKAAYKTTIALTDTGSNYKTNALVVNEAGLYKLIFKSRKEEAERFQDWITDEVLPMIRKTGGYVADEEMFIQNYLPHADEQTKLLFKVTLETVKKQNEKISIMQPKADYFDALVDRNLLTNFRDTAKELGIGERIFIKWLLENKYVYRDQKGKLKPFAKYVGDIFQMKEWERYGKADVQTLITPRGRETFRLLVKMLFHKLFRC